MAAAAGNGTPGLLEEHPVPLTAEESQPLVSHSLESGSQVPCVNSPSGCFQCLLLRIIRNQQHSGVSREPFILQRFYLLQAALMWGAGVPVCLLGSSPTLSF